MVRPEKKLPEAGPQAKPAQFPLVLPRSSRTILFKGQKFGPEGCCLRVEEKGLVSGGPAHSQDAIPTDFFFLSDVEEVSGAGAGTVPPAGSVLV